MNSSICIEQQGIVEKVDKDLISVKILQVSACSSCDAKSICQVFGAAEKVIDIADSKHRFQPGERVKIEIKRSMGTKAVILGYLLPFLLVLLSLIFFTAAGFDELKAGILSLCMLIPYYGSLRIFRKKLSRQFNFTLNKIE